MHTKHLIQSLVGTEKIVIKEIFLESETNAVVIVARPTKHEQCRCGICHRKSKPYDRGQGIRRWRCSNIGNRVYKELESQSTSRFDGLNNIGIDETSYKKGHEYMTVVINHDTAYVVWCSVGYSSEVLSKFLELLTPEQRASIQCFSADGARWIASCIEKYCPNNGFGGALYASAWLMVIKILRYHLSYKEEY